MRKLTGDELVQRICMGICCIAFLAANNSNGFLGSEIVAAIAGSFIGGLLGTALNWMRHAIAPRNNAAAEASTAPKTAN